VRELLPFLGATFRSERLVHAAQGHAQTARQAAQQSDILARRLDSTRAQLQSALIAAEAATRAKDEFLSVVSHELRTPLNSIYGWSEIMRLSPGDAAIYEQGLATIERNVKAQARLIDDILDVARITSGQMRLEMRPLELGSVIAAALDAVSPAASAKQLLIATDFIATDLDARADLVTGDFDRLQQIVWNLLSNAIKFTPLQGQIFVTCRAHEGQVELSVRDSGIGISAEFLPYVFERFQQADSTSTRRHGGLGLGMAITRHLVELHGGHIRVCSDGPNCGTTFTVALPSLAVPAATSSAAPGGNLNGDTNADTNGASRGISILPPSGMKSGELPTKAAPRPDLSGVRVLIVDDEPEARTLLAAVLKQSRAQVIAASSVAEALEILRRERPDIVVSDIAMPEQDGYALISQIRKWSQREGTAVPVIALTAHARPSDRFRALSAGFQMHLPKPVDSLELALTIQNLLHRN
jgi:signal transduction histidine kinase